MKMNLNRNEILIVDREDVVLRCVEGVCWITVDGDPNDCILEPGATYKTKPHRRIVVQALHPALVSLAFQQAPGLKKPATLSMNVDLATADHPVTVARQ